MRKIFYFLIVPVLSFGQQLNYVKTITYKNATTTSISNPTIDVASQSMVYMDGFGKSIQQIAHQQSNTGKDIILPIEYDGMGIEAKKFLPYVNSAPSLNYNPNAISDQSNYSDYVGQYPFSETQYEPSSKRILQLSSPGVDWTMGSGHEVKFEYRNNSNVGTDKVKLFNAVATWNSTKGLYDISISQTTDYPPNTLSRKIIKNENWISGTDNTKEEFRDKSGRLLLERNYNGLEILDTYHVYDQFGNLTYVIPPKADMTISSTILDNLCYQYKYDSRNRLVEKKLPGKQWEYIVYDKLDRVVATGPALPPFSNLTASGWMINKYDAFNRVVITAWMSVGTSTFNSALRKTRQDERNNETIFSESRDLTTPDITVSGITFRYTNVSLPLAAYHILTVTYYDDYNYYNAPVVPSTISSINKPIYYNNTIVPKGLVTGKWVRASKASNTYRGKLSYSFYDENARPISVFLGNHEIGGGFTQIDTEFNFIGQPIYTVKFHKRIPSSTVLKLEDFYTYSDQDRLLTHTQKINNGSIQLLSSNEYDELGKLISKKVGNTINSPLQNVNYSYNIRNWLTDINDIDNLSQTSDPLDLFAFKINHNTTQFDLNSPIISKQYNGNVSETYWRTSSDNITRKYGYKYDKLNRLVHGYYRVPGLLLPSIKSYDEVATYDKNGNINTLGRNGDIESTSMVINIDQLAYSYETDSNKLLKITEYDPTQTSGFKDGTNTGDDYSYDANGNLTKDENKGIVNGSSNAIIYNHLNLPLKITFGTNGSIEYIYDAEGTKLEKITTQGSTITTTKYLNGFQYVNDVLQFFPFDDGYVAKIGSTYKYVFQYKDHLGNVRLSYSKNVSTGNLDIIEESNYYPFGLKHTGYNSGTVLASGNAEAQKYKFQGQERQEELGLNLDSFKWRNYDYAIGRFISIDPLSESYMDWSPYVFSGNRVVDSRELEGLEPYALFDSQREAAHNFVVNYNGVSILLEREFATRIYVVLNADGSESYGYTTPVAGESHESDPKQSGALPNLQNVYLVATGHTHGNYLGPTDNEFSGIPGYAFFDQYGEPNDIYAAEISYLDSYVGTPNSSFLEYNYFTNEVTVLDNDGVPGQVGVDPSTPDNAPSPDFNNYDYIDSRDGEQYKGTKSGVDVQRKMTNTYNQAYKPVLQKYDIKPDSVKPEGDSSDGDDDSYD